MRFQIILFTMVFVFLFSSCKHDTTSPLPYGTNFSIKITVTNLSDTPMPGLRISAYNHLSVGLLEKDNHGKGNLSSPQSTSVIGFTLAADAKVFLAIYEHDNKFVTTLLNWENMLEGMNEVEWSNDAHVPTRVYKYRLIAKDTSGTTVLFSDSLHAVLWHPDPDICILGWTSQNGIYETSDMLFFPNVLSLPILYKRDETNNDLGTFSILDSVTIILTDTLTHQSQQFQRVVTKDANDIQLVWNPTLSKQWIPYKSRIAHSRVTIRNKRLSSIHSAWKLFQNYPNPFN